MSFSGQKMTDFWTVWTTFCEFGRDFVTYFWTNCERKCSGVGGREREI